MNDRELDNLLREALEGDPPAEQVQRLERYWQSQLAADRRHRRAFAVALAASLALVVTGGAWLLQRSAPPEAALQVDGGPLEIRPQPKPGGNSVQLADDSAGAKPSASRPTTAYEQIMFRLSVAQAAKAEPSIVEMNLATALQQLEERVGLTGLPGIAETTPYPALRRAILHRLLQVNDDIALRGYLALVANEFTRFEALAAAAQVDDPPIDAFFRLLREEKKSVRTSAAMALGRINGPEVTAALIELVTNDRAAPAEAWIALLACRGESAEQFIADAQHHPRRLGRLNNARIFWQSIQ